MKARLNNHISHKDLYTFLAFIVFFTCYFFLMGYNRISDKGPFSRHAYRQSDSYSFSLTYYYDNNKFLEPSILFIGENGHGKTVSEFPILYFITAKIWKITGINPFVPRLLNLTILFIGLFYLYKLSSEILRDQFWSFIVSLSLLFSPLLGYYGFNFVPNIPALGFALIATYYFHKYYNTLKIKWLITATLLFSLAALLKISSLFLFLATNSIYLIHNLTDYRKKLRLILLQLSSVVIVCFIVLSWYLFTRNYNTHNLAGIFNQSIIPIWSLSAERIKTICDKTYTNTIIYFYNPQALIVIGAMFIFSLVLWRKAKKQLLAVTSVLFVGVVLFVLLFFDGMDEHEYFLIDATVIIPAIILTFLVSLKNIWPALLKSNFSKAFAVILMILLLDYTMVLTRAHYNPHDKMVEKNIPLAKRVKDYWDWVYWDWENNKKKYEGIVPYLRSLGIEFDDLVISIPDDSPDLTLSLLQQKGFTDYHYSNHYQGIDRTGREIALGAKYLIVLDNKNLLREDVAPFTQNQIGEYNGIMIFKLNKN